MLSASTYVGGAVLGAPLLSKIDAFEMPPDNSGYVLPPPGTTDASSVDVGTGTHAGREIKEWQAIMDYLRSLPVKRKGELPVSIAEACGAMI